MPPKHPATVRLKLEKAITNQPPDSRSLSMPPTCGLGNVRRERGETPPPLQQQALTAAVVHTLHSAITVSSSDGAHTLHLLIISDHGTAPSSDKGPHRTLASAVHATRRDQSEKYRHPPHPLPPPPPSTPACATPPYHHSDQWCSFSAPPYPNPSLARARQPQRGSPVQTSAKRSYGQQRGRV